MKILIACGGSGGHIFPGIALAQELAKGGNEVFIVTSDKKLDAEILKKSGYAFASISHNPFRVSFNPARWAIFFARFVKNISSSIIIILKFRPHCTAGFGGFASAPVIGASWLCGIPCIIHEQNLVAGLANRMESFFAKKIAVSFEETKKSFDSRKTVLVGNPVRPSLKEYEKTLSRRALGIHSDRFTVFIMGGSQGAGFLNRIVPEAAGRLNEAAKAELQVIHIAGDDGFEGVTAGYKKNNVTSRVFVFLDEVDKAYAASDLVIARSGATTIAELAYFKKPSILIPYPEKSVHQHENARYLSDRKAAIMLEEPRLDSARLKNLISDFMKDKDALSRLCENISRVGRPDAARLLAEEVLRVADARK